MAFTNNVSNALHTYPLTDVQLGIWMGDQIADSPNAFTIAHTVTIDGALNVALLASSIQAVLLASDTISACYIEGEDGQPGQIPGAEYAPKPEIIYVTDKQEPDMWVQTEITKDVVAPLKLSSGMGLCRQVLYVIPAQDIHASSQRVIWYQRFHHIMLDGYSLNVFTRQVAQYYQCAISGQAFPEAPFTPFYEVLDEEAAYKTSPRYRVDQSFWQEYISQLTPATCLSLSENRTVGSQTLLRQETLIPKSILDALTRSIAAKSVTDADVALALVFAYLHKMTGQYQITVCFPFMGRMGSAALMASGPAVNVLPLQVCITSEMTLEQLITVVKAELKNIRKHQKYNAEQIARDMGKVTEDTWSGAPTLNLLLFDNEISFAGIPATVQRLATGPVDDLDFNLHFDAGTGDLHLEWVANGARYHQQELAQHAERFADFVQRLAVGTGTSIPTPSSVGTDTSIPTSSSVGTDTGILTTPPIVGTGTSISTTPVASDRELALIHHWQNSPYPDAAEPLSDIVTQFFNRVSARSDSLAICTGQVCLSHKELTEKALQWARAFRAQGIVPGDRVGLALPRDERIVLAIFALMRLRVTYVPMDPEYPAARLEWMLEDAAPVAVLTTRELKAALPAGTPGLLVDEPEFIAQVNQQSAGDWEESQHPDPQDTAYIMYTSGSTGKPKGVSIPYQGITNLHYAHFVADYQPLSERIPGQIRAAHTASFSFDSSWDMLLLLLSGHTVFIIDEEMRRDPYAFVAYIRQKKLVTMDLPPSFLMQMIDAGLLAKGEFHPCESWVGGEAASPALWETVRQHPDFVMKNYYGPTENSVDSLGCAAQDAEKVVIGRPICQTKAYLLDTYLQPVPVGVVGELYVAGPGLAHGYINRPEQTASRFVANPYMDGERMYRTGDLARYLPDGQIDYIGRSDHQVQIRGFRVEPGEVESVLASLDGVTAALVDTEKQGNSYRLLAYCTVPGVTPENEAELTAQLLAGAAAVLPDYMIPAALKVLPAFQLNVNGKVDRSALPKPEVFRMAAGRLPRTPEERLICTAMADCLGLDEVYADDDFFRSGGDSIMAMSLSNLLRREGYRLRPKDIFAAKTAMRMAKGLTRIAANTAAQMPVARVAGTLEDVPILHWFKQQGSLTQSYIQAVFIRVPGDVDRSVMQRALQALAVAHPVLAAQVQRETLVIPETVCGQNSSNSVENWLISGEWPASFSLEQQAEQAFSRLTQSMAPTSGPLMQAWWLESEQEQAPPEKGLVLAIHHLAVDGVSWRILLPELQRFSDSLIRGVEPLPEKEQTPLRQWQSVLKDQVIPFRQQLAFWKAQLAPQHSPWFHTTRKNISGDWYQQSDLEHERLLLSVDTTKALLVSVPGAYRCDVEQALLSVMSLAWSHQFNTTDIRYTLESHGRAELADAHGNLSDLSRTVGWLTAEYPVRVILPESLSGELQHTDLHYENIVRTVRQSLAGTGEQGIGYGVLRYLDPQSRSELAVLEQQNRPVVLFNYLGRFREREETWVPQTTPDVFRDSFAVYQPGSMPVHHPVALNIFVQEDEEGARLALQWSWLPSVCARKDIAALTEYIAVYAEQMADHAGQHPGMAADTRVAADFCLPAIADNALSLLRGRYGALNDVLPLLPLQEGLLFHAQMGQSQQQEEDADYSTLVRLMLNGQLDLSRLRRALGAVLCKYPQLGAVFDTTTLTQPVQLLPLRSAEQIMHLWPLDAINLIGLTEREQARQLEMIEHNELRRDFMALQSAGTPLLHATLIRLEAEKNVLILNAHHLVMDGWSTPILLRDLLEAYGDDEVSLSAPAVPYASVVSSLVNREKERMRKAWQQSLTGVIPTMAFGDYPPHQSVTTYKLTLSASRFKQLSDRYKAHGVTLNSVLQTVWAHVLFSLTGRSDVVFGTPVSGRFNAVEGIDEHIGLFSNTVPVRVQFAPNRTVWEQIQIVQQEQVQLLEHDGLGLGEIQRLSGHSTLFDTLLVIENFPAQDDLYTRSFHGLMLTQVHNRGYTHYPLTILALPDQHLDILFEYRGTEAEIQPIIERFESLLDLLLVETELRFSRLDLRTQSEKKLIEGVNQTFHEVADSTLRTQMWAQFERTPDAVCVLDEKHALTYREAREQVVTLAQSLQECGVKPGDIVAVALPRSIRLTLALWAVTEVGAAFLPLDTGYPDDRLNYMLEDARPGALITQQSEALRFSRGVTLLFFESLFTTEADVLTNWQAPPLRSEDAAYLLYTSGSTGKPKGVMVPHQAIVNRLLWMQDRYPIDETDTVLQKTPCSFDVSVWEFFWSAMTGARLMMAPPESHRDPHILRRLIETCQITTIHFVPSMLAAFINSVEDEVQVRNPSRLCPGLRRVFCSGEALSVGLSAAFEQMFATPLHNLYGPTEAAVDVTYHPAFGQALASVDGTGVPIGKPVWNTQLRILDEYLRPSPVGVPGELYLSGVQLAMGYLGRSELTATRFVADPYADGERMYRTGDVVRWLPDGHVAYLGRSDDQLKIRGQRIELGEIERVLAAEHGVKQCTVVAKSWGEAALIPGTDTRQLVGYVIPENDAISDPALLRAALAEKLPIHMVPIAILLLETFPLSANGKLDRKALPLPSGQAGTAGRGPKPGLETQLADAFARILGVDCINADDDFFALGGHSLLAVRLVADLRRRWQLNVSVGQVMVSPSVEKLAHILSDEQLANNRDLAGFGQVLPIRQGQGLPVFCIHPASGFAWQYTGFSRYLDTHCALIGLQSPRPDGPIAAQDNMEGMITQHLTRLRQHQPQGPYRLMGYSLGGVIAHGIAVRLQEMGEHVSFLGLIDTYPPDHQDWSGPTEAEARQEAEREKAQFMNSTEAQMESSMDDEKDAMFRDIVANYADAIRHLSVAKSRRFNGKATLFVANKTLPEDMDVEATWAPFVAQLDQYYFEYPHEDILSPDALVELGPLVNQLIS